MVGGGGQKDTKNRYESNLKLKVVGFFYILSSSHAKFLHDAFILSFTVLENVEIPCEDKNKCENTNSYPRSLFINLVDYFLA